MENWGLAQFGYGTPEAELSQVDVVVDLQVTMKIGFKWPSRTKVADTKAASSASRRASARPRGKGALSSRKPATGWSIKFSASIPKRSLAQLADCDGDDKSEEYYEGLEAALDALTQLEEASDDFVEGFLDGVMSMLPDDALAI